MFMFSMAFMSFMTFMSLYAARVLHVSWHRRPCATSWRRDAMAPSAPRYFGKLFESVLFCSVPDVEGTLY